MTTLVVETTDLAGAAHILFDRVGVPLDIAVGDALSDAVGFVEMAGDDPSGQAWAESYAPAASHAAKAAQDVTNGVFALSRLLGASAQNYANAEAASTIDARHAVEGVIDDLPPVITAGFPTRFADVAGAVADPPWCWSIVQHVGNLVWPDGHQDLLLQAASAWHHSADALTAHARNVDLAIIEPLIDGIPEWTDIRSACWSLTAQIEEVAGAHRSLARACQTYAHHLDVVHSKALTELRHLLAESVGIEVIGNVLSVATEGLLEAPTQYLEGSRIAAAAARIGGYISEFGLAVGEVVQALPTVAALSARVSQGLDDLLSIRIVTAEVAGVPGLRVLSVARDGRTAGGAAGAAGAAGAGGEETAIAHLANDANLPSELRIARDSPRAGDWNNPNTLARHVSDHGSDFGITTEGAYISKSREFFQEALRDRLPTKIADNGNIKIYDPSTNTFAVYSENGACRTIYKPDRGIEYWNTQSGALVQ